MSAIIKQSLPIVEKMIQNASNQRQIALKESKFKVNLDNIKIKQNLLSKLMLELRGTMTPILHSILMLPILIHPN